MAAAERADAAAHSAQRGVGGDLPPNWEALAVEEARAMAAEPRGVRQPSLLSHLALIHAYANAGHAGDMFEAIARVQQVCSQAGGKEGSPGSAAQRLGGGAVGSA